MGMREREAGLTEANAVEWSVGGVCDWIAEMAGDYDMHGMPVGYRRSLYNTLRLFDRPKLKRIAASMSRRISQDDAWTIADVRALKHALARVGVTFKLVI